MAIVKFIIDNRVAGQRLDKAVASLSHDAGISRNQIKKLFSEGKAKLNGKPLSGDKAKSIANYLDEVELELLEKERMQVTPERMKLNIKYEDEDVIVVDKAAGLVVHPGVNNESGTLVNGLLCHTNGRLSKINDDERPGIVHRIDKDTSGLLMVAKTDKAYASLSKQLKEHSSNREYIALVHNNFVCDEGSFSEPIGRDSKNRLKRWVNFENGKNATTHYKVIQRFGDYTLIKCILETGRTHQIRVHMAYHKHPIVGDPLYGVKNDRLYKDGQLLHAALLGFNHPTTGEYMEFISDIPEKFEAVLEKLRKNEAVKPRRNA